MTGKAQLFFTLGPKAMPAAPTFEKGPIDAATIQNTISLNGRDPVTALQEVYKRKAASVTSAELEPGIEEEFEAFAFEAGGKRYLYNKVGDSVVLDRVTEIAATGEDLSVPAAGAAAEEPAQPPAPVSFKTGGLDWTRQASIVLPQETFVITQPKAKVSMMSPDQAITKIPCLAYSIGPMPAIVNGAISNKGRR